MLFIVVIISDFNVLCWAIYTAVKVVLHRSHGWFFWAKVKTVKLVGGRRFLADRTSLNARTCLPKSYRWWYSLRSWISGDLGDLWRTTLKSLFFTILLFQKYFTIQISIAIPKHCWISSIIDNGCDWRWKPWVLVSPWSRQTDMNNHWKGVLK